jgi:hypothetical protein
MSSRFVTLIFTTNCSTPTMSCSDYRQHCLSGIARAPDVITGLGRQSIGHGSGEAVAKSINVNRADIRMISAIHRLAVEAVASMQRVT